MRPAADDYYREALKRDPSDSRCCTALGRRLIARGRFTEAEELLRRAVERLTFRNPNPSDGEAIYHLGRTLFYQQRYDEAYRCFYKAIWCDAQKSSGFYHLALIDCRRGEYTTALGHLQQSLDSSYRNHTARDLASTVLRKLSRTNDALQMSTITRTLDRGDWGALYELSLHSGSTDELRRLMRASDNNYLELSLEYSRAGLIEDALQVLELLIEQKPLTKCSPLISYHRAYLLYRMDRETGRAAYQAAQEISPHGCFPSKLESLIVLQEALDVHPADSRAHYYLGNAHYALQNHDEAMGHWEQSLAIDSSFPTAHRNLALAYMNKRGDQKQCELLLTRAFDLDTSDARVLYELDQFRKITNVPAEERLATLQAHMSAVTDRDDLYLEYITLLNQLGRYEQALSCISGRQFHPWEGGEGKVPAQYKQALTGLALEGIVQGEYSKACDYLERCRTYPHNLGEGKLFGTQEQDLDYLTALACERAGDSEQAERYYTRASEGDGVPVSAMYYNDQPPHMIYFQAKALDALGRTEEAKKKYETLFSYGTLHMRDHITIDYFAVSLPDFLVFEQDLDAMNTIHCLFMQYLGSQDPDTAEQIKEQLLSLDGNHIAGFISKIEKVAAMRIQENLQGE